MDKPVQRFPSWMILVIWVLVCMVGLHFLADNSQHISMAWSVDFPANQNASETFDEHQAETNFVIPDDGNILSPLALAIPVSPDGACAPLLFVTPLLNPPRA